ERGAASDDPEHQARGAHAEADPAHDRNAERARGLVRRLGRCVRPLHRDLDIDTIALARRDFALLGAIAGRAYLDGVLAGIHLARTAVCFLRHRTPVDEQLELIASAEPRNLNVERGNARSDIARQLRSLAP